MRYKSRHLIYISEVTFTNSRDVRLQVDRVPYPYTTVIHLTTYKIFFGIITYATSSFSQIEMYAILLVVPESL